MAQEHPDHSPTAGHQEANDGTALNLTAQQLADLGDEETQAEYRRAYIQQLQQRACPGCGDV